MAQWVGQYTGNTHTTKVRDIEETLEHSIARFRELNTDEEKLAKQKAITKIAEKLLNARLKFLKAKIYDTEPVVGKSQSKLIAKLKEQETNLLEKGVNGILIEFGAKDLIL